MLACMRCHIHCLSMWFAENDGAAMTRPGIAESFAPALSGITSEMQLDIQGIQKENRPPTSEGKLPFTFSVYVQVCVKALSAGAVLSSPCIVQT